MGQPYLGVETQRKWLDLAILRTMPALLGLFSLVTLYAYPLSLPLSISAQTSRHSR